MSHLQQDLGTEAVGDDERQSRVDDEMDLTPMVDVTFLLLIFFMVTAAFALQKALEVPPVSEETSPDQTVDDLEKDAIVVRVDQDNVFWIGAPKWDEEQRTPSVPEMLAKVREARGQGGDGPTRLLVQASGDSRHEFVVAALDAGTGVGMEEIQLMSYEEGDLDY